MTPEQELKKLMAVGKKELLKLDKAIKSAEKGIADLRVRRTRLERLIQEAVDAWKKARAAGKSFVAIRRQTTCRAVIDRCWS